MTEKRFTVEKLELVSDHLSTRFFIKDNEEDKYYDVQHIVSVGFEVQYESWADKIAEKMNELAEENEQSKMMIATLRNIVLENEDLEKENEELKSLLKECEHELTCDNGLSAFDKCASYIGYVEVFDKDIINLDHSKLLERIKQRRK